MKKFIELFNKVGGKNILAQYWRSRVLFFAVLVTVLLGFERKSLEIVRLAVSNRRLVKMRCKYQKFIQQRKSLLDCNANRIRTNKVWVLWLQGIDCAPELVQKCYLSLKNNLTGKEVVLLTEKNYRDYVEFPDYIQKKIDAGIISKTHFSDLLRLELLIKHGGTWIDATVFCSGKSYPNYLFDSDLFVYQCLKPGLDGHCTSMSSWFMSACTNNPIILLTRDLLYEYWLSNAKMMDYFLIHDFFQLSIEAFPDEWKKVVPFSNSTPHILLLRLFEPYDDDIWNAIKSQTCFHKLSYKFSEENVVKDGTYYKKVFG